jgi:hypothetical protein
MPRLSASLVYSKGCWPVASDEVSSTGLDSGVGEDIEPLHRLFCTICIAEFVILGFVLPF